MLVLNLANDAPSVFSAEPKRIDLTPPPSRPIRELNPLPQP
jgi:hypothetical protein